MTLPTLNDVRDWAGRNGIDAAARHFLWQIGEDERSGLAADPLAVIQAQGNVAVRFEVRSGPSCGVYGRYNADPPTIYLEPSNWGRDNFTVLHEYGHHLQQHDLGWADVLWRLRRVDLGWVEEQVSNRFAALVLIPDDDIAEMREQGAITAPRLRRLHGQRSASAQALLVRVAEAAYGADPVFVALADWDGTIVFAASAHPDMPHPPFGSVQPDIARLAQVAQGSTLTASGSASTGIRYSNGNTRSDLKVDVALSANGLLFVTARPAQRYATPQWARQEVECASAACGEIFTWDANVRTCDRCRAPVCPECFACSCEAQTTICGKCNLSLTPADIAASRQEHEDCW